MSILSTKCTLIFQKSKENVNLRYFQPKKGKKRGQKIKSKDAIINISSRQNTRRKIVNFADFVKKFVK